MSCKCLATVARLTFSAFASSLSDPVLPPSDNTCNSPFPTSVGWLGHGSSATPKWPYLNRLKHSLHVVFDRAIYLFKRIRRLGDWFATIEHQQQAGLSSTYKINAHVVRSSSFWTLWNHRNCCNGVFRSFGLALGTNYRILNAVDADSITLEFYVVKHSSCVRALLECRYQLCQQATSMNDFGLVLNPLPYQAMAGHCHTIWIMWIEGGIEWIAIRIL